MGIKSKYYKKDLVRKRTRSFYCLAWTKAEMRTKKTSEPRFRSLKKWSKTITYKPIETQRGGHDYLAVLPAPMRPIISTHKCLTALVREINTHLGYISNNAVHAYYSKSIVRVIRFS